MEPRHFGQKERYRPARAARHGHGTAGDPVALIDSIDPVHPVRRIRELGL
ncbi:MAG: hypothetical protein ACREML_03125 [Vulcanimicrobiaceae bacterium]